MVCRLALSCFIISRWSCDEGANLNSTEFADIEIRVVAMFTERGEKARHATYVLLKTVIRHLHLHKST